MKNTGNDEILELMRNNLGKFDSVEATIKGPLTASNGKLFYKASFVENVEDEDGYIGQPRMYAKCFFEDTHSFIYQKCQECLDNDVPLKIRAARIQIAAPNPYYILDENGKRMKKTNGDYRKGRVITIFALKHENPLALYQAQCDKIQAQNAWATDDVDPDYEKDPEQEIIDTSTSSQKPNNNTKPNAGKNGKK